MATIPGNSTSGLYGIGLNANTPVGNNYGNANVAAFLQSYQGNLTAGKITVQNGNIFGDGVIANDFYWANGVALIDTLYSNLDVQNYLPTYTGNVASTITQGTQPYIVNVGPQVDLTFASDANADGWTINNLLDPVDPQDAATKNYVDSIAQGLNVHAAVELATTTTLPPYLYNNGASGVGATITGLSNGLLTIDGVTVLVGNRVLIKNETLINSPYNGVYVCSRNNPGSTYQLTRASDLDTPTSFYNAYVYVSGGLVNVASAWINTNQPALGITIGVTPLTFAIFNTSSTYTAGAGISIANSIISVNTDGTTTSINGSNQVTVNLANNSSNISAPYYFGNIFYTTGGAGGGGTSISNGNSSVAIPTANGAIQFTVNTFDVGYLTQNGGVGFGIGAGNVLNPQAQALAIGSQSGETNQGAFTVAIGAQAGQTNQSQRGVAIGYLAAVNNQGAQSVAIGYQAGLNLQGAGAVAIGSGSGQLQNANAIAIGYNAGYNNLAVPQANNSIIIDATGTQTSVLNTGFYVAPVRNDTGNVSQAVYYNTATKEITYAPPTGNGGGGGGSSLVNGSYTFQLNSNGTLTLPNPSGTGVSTLSNQQNAVAFGYQAGQTSQSPYSVAVGYQAGQSSQSQSAVAVGQGAGSSGQSPEAVAIGVFAGQVGQGTQAVAIGSNAGANAQGNYSVAVGYGANAGTNSLALGRGAQAGNINSIVLNASGSGFSSIAPASFYVNPIRNDLTNVAQAIYYNTTTKELTYAPTSSGGGSSIVSGTSNVTVDGTGNGAINFAAGASNVGQITWNQVALGLNAGQSPSGGGQIALGTQAGSAGQATNAIAIGSNAGASNQKANGIAIGYQAGYGGGSGQATGAIAIGYQTAITTQANYATAIGYQAGNQLQGAYAIAMGYRAGYTAQFPNSIALNASGSNLDTTAAGFYVNPVRNDATNVSQPLYYNTATNEITYDNTNPLGNSGQTWQAPGRVLNSIYQNTSGAPIQVNITLTSTGAPTSFNCDVTSTPSTLAAYALTDQVACFSVIVPAGFYYKLASVGAPTIATWTELR